MIHIILRKKLIKNIYSIPEIEKKIISGQDIIGRDEVYKPKILDKSFS